MQYAFATYRSQRDDHTASPLQTPDVISAELLSLIRRLHYRQHKSLRAIAQLTGLSRNTVKKWLRSNEVTPVTSPRLENSKLLDEWEAHLVSAMAENAQKSSRDRRTARELFRRIQALGYKGSYSRVTEWIRAWKVEQDQKASRTPFVPLLFEHGEAFQFDWSCEYAFVGGLRKRLEVAHVKLACSRAFWLVAYFSQSHEMLFDAHARAFEAFGGVPRRGIYDNMRTAVDRVGVGKQRTINIRFQALCSHYLFEPEFCNRASGWEKGIVEKNVQDRRRQVFREAAERRWKSLAELNQWLGQTCQRLWTEIPHPVWPELTIADVLVDEQRELMPCPQRFDGYIETPVRVSVTSLVNFQRNRYSVPVQHVNHVLSLRAYPTEIVIVADGNVVARHERIFEQDQTSYDWQHYIEAAILKPGSLRNGEPFRKMPEEFKALQRVLQRQPGGDRSMTHVLAAVPVHGLDAVIVAVQLALECQRPSAEYAMNVLARMTQGPMPAPSDSGQLPRLISEPIADVGRYDQLRAGAGEEGE